ncbi:MAG: hypothetical protein PVF27_07275 [Gemmatimonadales bacterium]|jgi:hypothetical protein
MHASTFFRLCWAGSCLLTLAAPAAQAQIDFPDSTVEFRRRNLGGPRLGVTYVSGNGDLWQDLDRNGMGRLVSQFGWHFEFRVVPETGGPQFVVQLVPMIGGVEYGKLVPTGTLAMGVRFPNGIEFGLGPNALVRDGVGGVGIDTGLMIGIGRSFLYRGVSLPVNLVWVTNPSGNRFSVIFGYAIS